MKKEVTIKINGDLGNEEVTGNYMCENGRHHLMYEMQDTENEGCVVRTIMHFGDESIRMVRKTVREKNETLLAHLSIEWRKDGGEATYHTPYGIMEFSVNVLSLTVPKMGQNKISAEVEYELISREEMLRAEKGGHKAEAAVKNRMRVEVL